MSLFHIIVLALIQGITEFLPISSSAHLLLPSLLLDWPDQGLSFDVAAHVGTLLAVIIYFRQECKALLKAWLSSFSGKVTDETTLSWMILLATIPAATIGFVFNDFIAEHLRQLWIVATTTLVFGLLLGVAEYYGIGKKTEYQIGFSRVLIIALAQALALVPGTSRSGITMTAGLLCGMSRVSAARFSFLLWQMQVAVQWLDIGLGVVMSFVAAVVCIYLFLRWIERLGFMMFVVYRILLSAVLFSFIYFGA